MVRAVWNDKVIAESDKTEIVEGNHYFPPESVKKEFLKKSEHQTHCPWKGEASYYNLDVSGKINENAAWFYLEPKEAAKNIKDYIAFWNGVEIRE